MAVTHMVAFKDKFTSTISLHFSGICFRLLRFCVHDISFLYTVCPRMHAAIATSYSVHMSLESIHKLMGLYMEVLISGIALQYKVSTSISCFLRWPGSVNFALCNRLSLVDRSQPFVVSRPLFSPIYA